MLRQCAGARWCWRLVDITTNGHHRCCLLHHWFEAAAEQLCSNQDHRTLSSYLHHLCKTTIHDVPFLGNCRYPTFFSKLNDFTLYYKVLDLDDTSGGLAWGTMMQVLPCWSPVFVVIRNYCVRRLRYVRLNKHMTDNGCIENIHNSQTVHSINEVCKLKHNLLFEPETDNAVYSA